MFLRLGLTSFGGPVAHLGYFRTEFVDRRRWLDDYTYSDLVALCQFLPGPASSQVGMAIGLKRAGWTGMLAAWLAFTLLGHGADAVRPGAGAFRLVVGFRRDPWPEGGGGGGHRASGVGHGPHALSGPDPGRHGVAALITLALPSAPGQLAAIALGAVVSAAVPSCRLAPCSDSRRKRAARRGSVRTGSGPAWPAWPR